MTTNHQSLAGLWALPVPKSEDEELDELKLILREKHGHGDASAILDENPPGKENDGDSPDTEESKCECVDVDLPEAPPETVPETVVENLAVPPEQEVLETLEAVIEALRDEPAGSAPVPEPDSSTAENLLPAPLCPVAQALKRSASSKSGLSRSPSASFLSRSASSSRSATPSQPKSRRPSPQIANRYMV